MADNEEKNNQDQEEDINIDDLFSGGGEEDEKSESKSEGNQKEAGDNTKEADPEAISKAIADGIEKGVKVVTTIGARNSEIETYLNSDEGKPFAKYSEQIRRVALDSKFRDLSMGRIVGLTLGDKMATIAAQAKKDAEDEQRGNQGGNQGNANNQRDSEGREKVSAWDMTPEEFEKTMSDAKAGKFLPK